MLRNTCCFLSCQDTGKAISTLPGQSIQPSKEKSPLQKSGNDSGKSSLTEANAIPFFESLFAGTKDTTEADSTGRMLSTTVAAPGAGTSYTTSLFTDHLLQVKNLDNKPNKQEYAYWIPAIMLIVFSVYTWIKIRHSQRLNNIFRSLYDNNMLNQLKREESFYIRNILLYLAGCFICILSLYLYKSYTYYHLTILGIKGPLVFITFCFILVLMYGTKIILLKLSGYLFNCHEDTHDYIYNILIFNVIIGIVLSPLLLLLFYLQGVGLKLFINVGAVLIAIILIYRIIKALIAGMARPGISKFYLFLYLCTLEIIPILVVFKIITTRVH